jgi:DNA-binding response OmpR family regulator
VRANLAVSPEGRVRVVLVVEDELLIAMELVASLEEKGFQVMGPAPTVSAALKLIRQQRPDAAVLDVNLRDGRVTPVAEALRSAGVPFVVASAVDRVSLAENSVLRGAPNLGKPTPVSELIDTLSDLFGQ